MSIFEDMPAPPRAIRGNFIGERLSSDLSTILYTIRIETEELVKCENMPMIGDEVTIS